MDSTPAPIQTTAMNPIAYLSYYDSINEQKAKALMQACGQVIAQVKPSQLYFLFSSPGGSTDAGFVLYHYLRALPVPVVMHNIGSINSVGNVVFLAADERYAVQHSSFLLHGIQWGFPQGAQLSWSQLQEQVDRFRDEENRMAGIISERTTISVKDLKQLFRQGETKDLAFAQEKGIISGIREAKVPDGAPFVPLNFT